MAAGFVWPAGLTLRTGGLFAVGEAAVGLAESCCDGWARSPEPTVSSKASETLFAAWSLLSPICMRERRLRRMAEPASVTTL